VHLKLQINNLVDLSTVAAIQNSNRSWVKIHPALWVSIQSAITVTVTNQATKQVLSTFYPDFYEADCLDDDDDG
jgi:hypothetical protein